MTDSATIEASGGLRERKRSALRASISDAARALTLEHGFSHFTIEQLCEQVGVSRRTFFNYFPSKEDALVGHHEDGIPEHVADQFLRGGRGLPDGRNLPDRRDSPGTRDSADGEVSPSLLEDLVELFCQIAEQSPLDREQYRKLIAAIGKEPALLPKIIGGRDKWEAEVAALIAQREHLDPNDPRAVTASTLVASLSHTAGKKYFSPDNTDSYRTILTGYVTAAKTLL